MTPLLLLMATAAFAGGAAWQPKPTPGITPITSPDGVYRVTFPCRPSPQPVAAADPAIGTSQMIACDEGDFVATAVMHQMVILPDAAMLDAQLHEQVVSRIPSGKVVRDERITRGGQAGRAVQVRGTDHTLNSLTFILAARARRQRR